MLTKTTKDSCQIIASWVCKLCCFMIVYNDFADFYETPLFFCQVLTLDVEDRRN